MNQSPDPTTKSRRLLTVSDVAQWLNVSPSLVYQLIEAKRILVCRIGIGRGAIRFRMEDVEAFVSQAVDHREPIRIPKPSRTHLKHIRRRKPESQPNNRGE